MISLLVLPLTMTAGCAQYGEARVSDGSAVYRLERPDCRVEIVSARAVDVASLRIGEDCSLEADAESTKSSKILELIRGGVL